MNQRTLERYATLAGIFGLGILIGLLLWNQISLPYDNPTGTYGLLAKAHHDKSTNSARFLIFLSIPLALLMLAYPFRLLRDAVFNRDHVLENKQTMLSLHSKHIGLIVLTLVMTSLAAHYFYLESIPGRTKPQMDHFHQGDVTASVVATEHSLTPYHDFFPSRGMLVDVYLASAAFALFGRSQASIVILSTILMVCSFLTIGWLLIKAFKGNYLLSASTATLLLGFTLVSYILPVRFTERDLVYALFLILILSLINAATARKVIISTTILAALVPLGFAVSADRGYILMALMIITWPLLYWIMLRENPHRRTFLLSSIAGFAAGSLILGWAIKWNFTGFAQFTFADLPAYREYVEGQVYFISANHLRGSAYRIYILLIEATAAFWLCYKILQFCANSGRPFGQSVLSFIREYFFEIAFFMLAMFAFRYALGRSDRQHIAGGASWTTFYLLYIFLRYYLPRFITSTRMKGAFLTLIVPTGIGGVAAYANKLLSHDKLLFAYPYGFSDQEMLTPDYQQVVEFLKPLVDKSNLFVSLTNEGSWYYLLNQPSPTIFAEIWYGSTEEFQKRIISQLQSKPITYALYANDAPWSNIDSVSVRDRVPKIFEYIEENFQPYKKFGSQDIWIRKGKLEPTTPLKV